LETIAGGLSAQRGLDQSLPGKRAYALYADAFYLL
jgi:hypothetical protein